MAAVGVAKKEACPAKFLLQVHCFLTKQRILANVVSLKRGEMISSRAKMAESCHAWLPFDKLATENYLNCSLLAIQKRCWLFLLRGVCLIGLFFIGCRSLFCTMESPRSVQAGFLFKSCLLTLAVRASVHQSRVSFYYTMPSRALE